MSARKIAYNTIAQVAGRFIGLFISSFNLVILAAKFGTSGMGNYTTVIAFVGFFVTLADLGINLIMSREIAQEPHRSEEITGDYLGFRLVYSLMIMALAPLVAYLIPNYRASGVVVWGVAIMAVSQFMVLINQNFASVLQVNMQLDRSMLAEVINRIVTLILSIIGIHLYSDIHAFFFFVMWTSCVASLAQMGVTYLFARRFWRIWPRFNLKTWREAMAVLIPMGTFTFLGMVHFKADTIILSIIKPAYDVGVYGYAYKLVELIFTVPILFIGSVYPLLSTYYKDDRDKFYALGQTSFRTLIFVTFPTLSGLYILAPYLTTLLSRQSVHDGLIAGTLLRILTIAMFMWFFEALFHHMLLIAKEYTGLIRNLSVVVICNLGLNFILIPRYTYWAAAYTTVISGILMLILSYFYTKRVINFKPKLEGIVPVLTGTIGMWLALDWFERVWHQNIEAYAVSSRFHQLETLLVFTIFGGLVYVAILAAWGPSSPLFGFYRQLRKKDA